MATCGHCGYESHGVATCPLCGHPVPDPDAAGPGSARGPLAAWEDPSVGFPRDLVTTWGRSLLDPARFFRGVPFEDPALRPLLYFLIVAVLSALFTLWWQTVGALPSEVLGLLGAAGPSPRWAAVGFFLAPFRALLALLVYGAAVHVLSLLLAPRRRGFGATLRALCYAGGPWVLTAVPWLGGLIGGVWSVVLAVVGVREAHRTTTGRAAAMVLIPVGALVVLSLGLAALALVAAAGPWLE